MKCEPAGQVNHQGTGGHGFDTSVRRKVRKVDGDTGWFCFIGYVPDEKPQRVDGRRSQDTAPGEAAGPKKRKRIEDIYLSELVGDCCQASFRGLERFTTPLAACKLIRILKLLADGVKQIDKIWKAIIAAMAGL